MVRIVWLTGLAIAARPVLGQTVQVIDVDGSPEWGDGVRLVEEVRIGTIAGDPAYAFGSVASVAVTDDGTVWVGDSQLGAIRRYGPDGGYLGQVGRKGEGPGEFRYPTSMRVLSDGTLVVWDAGQIRVSRFAPDGSFLDSFSPATHMIGGEPFEVDIDDTLYLFVSNMASLTREQMIRPGSLRLWWMRMTLDGEVLDSVPVEPSEREGSMDPIMTMTQLSPLGYRVVARNDDYALDLHVEPQRTVRLRRSWEPVPYERAERAEKQRLEELFVSRTGRPERRIPEDKLPFSHFEIDSEGRIWVQVAAAGYPEPESPGEEASRLEGCEFFAAPRDECDAGIREWRQPAAFEVLTPDGRYLGRLEFENPRTDLMVARGLAVWTVELGEFGEAYVVRYRIEPRGWPLRRSTGWSQLAGPPQPGSAHAAFPRGFSRGPTLLPPGSCGLPIHLRVLPGRVPRGGGRYRSVRGPCGASRPACGAGGRAHGPRPVPGSVCRAPRRVLLDGRLPGVPGRRSRGTNGVHAGRHGGAFSQSGVHRSDARPAQAPGPPLRMVRGCAPADRRRVVRPGRRDS